METIPKLKIETYKKKLPSSGELITFRPALVKEEKIWLMGSESENVDELFTSLIQVAQNCIIEPQNFSVLQMSYNDFVWLFIEIMKVSKGETIHIDIPCKNPECAEGGKPFFNKGVPFKLSEIVQVDNIGKNKSKIVKLSDTKGVELKYPTVEYSMELVKQSEKSILKNVRSATLKLIQTHITAFLDGETRYNFTTPEEAIEWTDNNLTKKDIQKIQEWFVNEPRLIFKFEWTCSKCKTTNQYIEKELLHFLGL